MEMIHSDINGPIPITSMNGSRYVLTFMDISEDDIRREEILVIVNWHEEEQNVEECVTNMLRRLDEVVWRTEVQPKTQ